MVSEPRGNGAGSPHAREPLPPRSRHLSRAPSLGGSFARGFWVRAAALLAVVTLAAPVLLQPELVAPKIVMVAVTALVAGDLLRFVRRTNRELARFVGALDFRDASQTFSAAGRGSGFDDLGRALERVMDRVREARAADAAEARFLRALVEHVPIPLMAVGAAGRLELLNGAARRLFAAPQIASLEGLKEYGDRLWRDVGEATPGRRQLTEMTVDGTRQAMMLGISELEVGEARQRIVSLQNIQGELDANELAVWRELVRVLTHEIMNSLTPLTSLAKSAVQELAAVDRGDGALGDARVAVETLERRADRLMHFVQSYRRLTKLPPPRPRWLAVEPFVAEVARVFRAQWTLGDLALSTAVDPGSLELFADAEQIEQALLNLLNTAAQAATEKAGPAARVWLTARATRAGRVVVEVADNGPGIAADIRDSIFLPFFTTKPVGTGVGLSLTRQIALAHGASITVGDRDGGGALLRLTFAPG